MNWEQDERILDAGLEEVLGGHYPPDLSARIVERLEARQSAATNIETVVAPVARPLVVAEGRRRERRTSRSYWWAMATAAGIAAIGISVTLLTAEHEGQPLWSIIAGSTQDSATDQLEPSEQPKDTTPPFRIREERFAAARSRDAATLPSPAAVATVDSPVELDNQQAQPTTPTQPRRPRIAPSSNETIIAFVNDVLSDVWDEHSVTPSPAATDRQWYRRAHRSLTGGEAAEQDLMRFVRDRSADKRHQAVRHWLDSETYAQHWAEVESRSLVGTAATSADLADHLQESVRAGKPYDQLVQELIAACGSTDPADADYNPAVGFIAAGAGNAAVESTDRIARVFLGKQLACTRCHAHPTNDWHEGGFWELNAFLRQLHVAPASASGKTRVGDVDYFGASGAGTDAEVFYKLAGGRLGIAYPQLAGQPVSRSGLLEDINRRRELAKLVVASDDFARATVNRIWASLLGYGFTQPVDDMGTHNPPAHPEILDRLADEFVAHNYDLDALVQWIVLSAPFGLSEQQTPESWMDAPEAGGRPLFARYYSHEDNVPGVYKSLLATVDSRPGTTGSDAGMLARRSWTQPQVGNLRIIATEPGITTPGTAWLDRLASSRLRPEKKIDHVFFSVLNRSPTSRELTACKLILADRFDDATALREIRLVLLAYSDAPLANGSE